MAVRVVTDSASGIDPSELERLSIQTVPLHVILGDRVLTEEELQQPDFFESVASLERLPRTSQPSPEDFAAVFRSIIAKGHDVLAVLISSGLSGTMRSAEMAADVVRSESPGARIALVDSKSNSMEEGFAVLAAAEAAAAGADLEACADAAEETTRRTRFLFTPRTLEHLRRGGRISGAAGLLAVALKIAPILTAEKGLTSVAGVARSGKAAWKKISSILKSDVERFGFRRAAVQYFADKAEGMRFVAEVVQPVVGRAVPLVPIPAVVGVHVGPAVGVAYETELPMR
ncbi:MAG: DegV family protein [Anaerosomatales bacterium]|nr:DegV family protein [Anaerosomatales bacterium]